MRDVPFGDAALGVTHRLPNTNATVRWVSRWDAFPFHPLLVRTLKSATNDDGSDHGLPIGSAMSHPPRTPPRGASWDALHMRPNGFLSYLWQPLRDLTTNLATDLTTNPAVNLAADLTADLAANLATQLTMKHAT